MLASLDSPIAASDSSWSDIGREALLDVLRGLTGAAGAAAGKITGGLNPGGADAAAAAAAARAASDAQQKRLLLIGAGVAGAVVLGVLLMRR
jgi:hypothetical protein